MTHSDPSLKRATPLYVFPRLFDRCVPNFKTGRIFQTAQPRKSTVKFNWAAINFFDLKNVRFIFSFFCDHRLVVIDIFLVARIYLRCFSNNLMFSDFVKKLLVNKDLYVVIYFIFRLVQFPCQLTIARFYKFLKDDLYL